MSHDVLLALLGYSGNLLSFSYQQHVADGTVQLRSRTCCTSLVRAGDGGAGHVLVAPLVHRMHGSKFIHNCVVVYCGLLELCRRSRGTL